MRQLLASRNLRLWGIRLTWVLLLLATLGSGVVYAQDGEEQPEPDTPLAQPERTSLPLVPVDMVYVAEVAVATVAQLEQLLAMGHACADLGVCSLEVSGDELSALKEAGLEVAVVEQAIKFSSEAPEAPPPPQPSRYGVNTTNYNIPDRTAGGYGFNWSFVDIAGATAGARVTKVKYTVRIVHSWVGDLLVKLGHASPTYVTVWNRLGGTTDGGNDDDTANDNDIFLNGRWEYTAFDDDLVNQRWYLNVWDQAYGDTGYIDYFQLWVYYRANQPPTNGLVNPNSGNSNCGQLVYFYTYHYDNDGNGDIKAARFHVGRNSAPKSLAGNAVFNYHVPSNTLRIRNNNGTKWWGGKTVGSLNVVQNAQAKVYCNLTTVTKAGNMIRVRWAVVFKCTFRSTKKMYTKTRDQWGAATPLQQKGTWRVN